MLFNEIEKLNKNNYFYIDSTFIEEDDLLKILNIYNNSFYNNEFSEQSLNELKQVNSNTGSSFLYLKPEILKENK